MAEKQKQDTRLQVAEPTGISLYQAQKMWVKSEAKRQAKEAGRPVSTSKVIQDLIDEKRKAGQ